MPMMKGIQTAMSKEEKMAEGGVVLNMAMMILPVTTIITKRCTKKVTELAMKKVIHQGTQSMRRKEMMMTGDKK